MGGGIVFLMLGCEKCNGMDGRENMRDGYVV